MTTRDPRRNGEADALPRDEALSRAYRGQAEAAPAGPPAALDARILAAARQAVAAPRQPAHAPLPWWRRLMVPASVAAVLVVSATLTLMVHDEQQKLEAPAPAAAPRAAPESAPPPPVSPAPAEVPAPSRDSAAGHLPRAMPAERDAPAASTLSNETPAAPETRAKAAKRADDSAAEMRKFEAAPATEAMPMPAPSAFPAPAPMAPPPAPPLPADAASGAGSTPGAAVGGAVAPALPRSERESRVRQMREATPLPQAAPAAPAAATPQGVAVEPATRSQDASERPARPEMRKNRDLARSPEDWLEEIRQLRRSGRETEWREALERFRARYPDYPVPEDLR